MDRLPHPIHLKSIHKVQRLPEPVVTTWENGERQEWTGEEAARFIRRSDRAEDIGRIIFLPVAIVWNFVLVPIHNGIEWLYCKIAGER